jgi:quercetin 2,3-dioxygenase
MSAGTGIRHSEYNHAQAEPVHFLQIWIHPRREGLPPSYEQRALPPLSNGSQLDLIGSHDGRDESVTIQQDVNLHRAWIPAREALTFSLHRGRHAWLQVAHGVVSVNDVKLTAGDGLAASNTPELIMHAANDNAEMLVFDLA